MIIGDSLKIEVEVASKNEKTKRVEFKCQVTNQDGKTVTRGTAEVLAPTEKVRVKRPEIPEIKIN